MESWYLINGKGDDFGACTKDLIFCEKSLLTNVYNYKVIPKEDVEILKKYFDVVNDFVGEDESLEEYLEEHYS